MLGLVEQVKAYERLTVAAALSGDRGEALRALVANPLAGGYETAAPMLDALLEAHSRTTCRASTRNRPTTGARPRPGPGPMGFAARLRRCRCTGHGAATIHASKCYGV